MNEKTRAAWKRRKGKLTSDELVVWDELQALGRSKLAEAFRRQFVSKVLSADSDLAGATQYFAATRSLVQRWARCPRRKHQTLCVPRMALHRGPERGSATTLPMCAAADTQAATCSQVPTCCLVFPALGVDDGVGEREGGSRDARRPAGHPLSSFLSTRAAAASRQLRRLSRMITRAHRRNGALHMCPGGTAATRTTW